MPNKKIRKIFIEIKNSEKINRRARFLMLLFFGFLIGVMFKSQAQKSILIGYEDHKIFKNELIALEKAQEFKK